MEKVDNIKNNPIIKCIEPFLKDTQTYIVGGFLRDLILDRESCDVDLVVEKDIAEPLARKIADGLNGYFVPLDEVNKIYRVVMEDKVTYIDVAECIGADILEDLKRRDFTINALGFDLNKGEFIDCCGCLDDIKNKTIKEISEKNIIDDPLRILRAFRFQSELGFTIDDSLKNLLKKHAEKLNQSAKERVNTELVKLFAGENAPNTLLAMDEVGILDMIFPEIIEVKKIPPNTHHHLDLFHHSIEIVNQVTKYLKELPKEAKEHFASQIHQSGGGGNRLGYLKIAAFLHDFGKPQTWTIEEDTGRHRFYKHDDVGSKLVFNTLKTLKFSNKQIKYIQKLIKYHIYPANVTTLENNNEKNIMRFYRKMGDEVFDVIAISHSDRLSALGPSVTQEMVNNNINGLKKLMENYIEIKDRLEPLPKLLSGQEIMEMLNLKAGPKLGKIIKALQEAQLSSEVKTREDAVEFVKRNFR